MKKTVSVLLMAAALAVAAPALAQYAPHKLPTYGGYAPPKPAPLPQAPYANYGTPSTANGLPRTNTVSGYLKKDGTYVNPYARSK